MKTLAVAILAALIAGCSSVSVQDYAGREPVLDLAEYFNGPLTGWGIVQDRSGELRRSFRVDLVGRWDGDEGVLEEDFFWSDGERQERVWRFRKIDENTYSGTAGDVVGEATGEAYGNALRWEYVLALDLDGDVVNVTLDDWMWLLEGDVLVNRSEIRKFGLRVGEVTLFFRKGVHDHGG
jgi:hypothetical protein